MKLNKLYNKLSKILMKLWGPSRNHGGINEYLNKLIGK